MSAWRVCTSILCCSAIQGAAYRDDANPPIDASQARPPNQREHNFAKNPGHTATVQVHQGVSDFTNTSQESGSLDAYDPRVIRKAVEITWQAINNERLVGLEARGRLHQMEDDLSECAVDALDDVNSLLQPVREDWKLRYPGDFMSAKSVQEQASALLGKFTKLNKVTEGSKSGSQIFISEGSQLFLKSEGSKELNALLKERKDEDKTKTFLEEYVARMSEGDVCVRSTLMRYLMLFKVRCTSKKLGFWKSETESIWMLFANIVPYTEVPRPVHQFDLKASRDQDDCHAKAWTGEAEKGGQGYLGDFLAVYKETLGDTECDPKGQEFHGSSRKVCFLQALHLDLRLLARYHLIDYSLFVFVNYYSAERDEKLLGLYNNMLRVSVLGQQDLVVSIGTIDLLKDWDNNRGVRIQSALGLKKGIPIPGLATTLFGQDKYQSYPYYLFCTSVSIMDPQCPGRRSLQVLADCPHGDSLSIDYPGEKGPSKEQEQSVIGYMEEGDYCDLVNSCVALLQKPFASHNLDVCEEHACRIFHHDRCASYVLPSTGVQRSGKWKRWVLPWTTMGLKRRESTDVLDDQQTLLTEDDEWS